MRIDHDESVAAGDEPFAALGDGHRTGRVADADTIDDVDGAVIPKRSDEHRAAADVDPEQPGADRIPQRALGQVERFVGRRG